jgi:prepilin-type N-terminal cleavage/methylation domain-containing protein
MTKFNKRLEKGFTLVELLVVIAIIAILAGGLMLTINPQAMMQKGRDSTRMKDLATLRDAINIALTQSQVTLSDTTGVCATCTSLAGTQAVDGTGWVTFGAGSLANYVPALPVDPVNTGTNIYSWASDGSGFEINTLMEHADNATEMSTDGGNEAAVYEVGTDLTLISAAP